MIRRKFQFLPPSNTFTSFASLFENDMDSEVNILGNQLEAEITINLPSIRVFKIGAYFKLGESTNQETTGRTRVSNQEENHRVNLSIADRTIINQLQQDLPLNLNPYEFMSNKLSMDIETFLNHIKSKQ